MRYDLVVIGAGAAGIAAARFAQHRGASVVVLEARRRIGGRAVTISHRGHAIDLGAHWLHAGPINPLVALARESGAPIRRAPLASHLVIGGRLADGDQHRAFGRAFDLADRALMRAAASGPDRAAGSALPPLGRFGAKIAQISGLVCGRPLGEVSLRDYPSLEYADNWFIAGGYGNRLARQADGLSIETSVAVDRVARRGSAFEIGAGARAWQARRVIVTVPPTVLATGAIRFEPVLPDALRATITAFRPGIYEHVVVWWPSSPFRGADRLASIVGGTPPLPGLLARIDGTPLHYVELDAPLALALRGPIARAALVRRLLGRYFGRKARDLQVLAVTDWLGDPLSRGSWSVLGPGDAGARAVLAEPQDGLAFAGEWGDPRQWGTVGGAFVSGEAACRNVLGG